jgi:hypothetical protein
MNDPVAQVRDIRVLSAILRCYPVVASRDEGSSDAFVLTPKEPLDPQAHGALSQQIGVTIRACEMALDYGSRP